MTVLAGLSLRRRVRGLLRPFEGAGPGITVGVSRGGEVVLHESAGMASVELGVPVGPETCFRIASVSKQFTCLAVLMLAQEGRLSVEDPVGLHLPELPEWGGRVTLDQLMHNTGGVRDMLEVLRQGGGDLGLACTAPQLLAGVLRQRALNFEPGTALIYSNAGFLLLGLVVERVAGRPLAAVLRERVFEPLGMTRTAHVPDTREPVPGLATGYLPRRAGGGDDGSPGEAEAGGFLRAPHALPLGGEGGLVSGVEDLLLWERNLPRPGAEPLVAAEAVRGLAATHRFPDGSESPYARGLLVRAHRGVRTQAHGGLWPGYRTEFLRAPEAELAVVAISNHGGSDPTRLAHQVLDLLLEGRPGVHPVAALPDASALAAMSGRWLDRERGTTLDVSVGPDGAPVLTQAGVASRAEAAEAPAEPGAVELRRGAVVLRVRALGPDALEARMEAGRRAVLARVAPGAALPEGLAGPYRSAEMAAEWRFEDGAEGMTVAVDGPLVRGARWTVEAVEGDDVRVWVPGVLMRGWMDVRVRRDASGAVAGLVVNTGRLRGVAWERA